MAWIRLSDDYNDHPKFDRLSDGAFRLWHQGMGFCRKFQTDGLIPTASLKQFKAYSAARMRILLTPWRDEENPLWHGIEDFGVKVHDYLEWNLSKEEESKDRDGAALRMRRLRKGRRDASCSPERPGERSPDVPGRDGLERSLERKTDLKPIVRGYTRMSEAPDANVAQRAGQLVERYGELFYQHRRGARLMQKPVLDFEKACDLVKTWPDDARLEKLAVIVLTTDDEWVSRTDRGFGIFAAKASWADDRLAAWEADQARTA